MNFTDLILKRHSTRRFTDKKLSQDEVVTLIQSALLAPSGRNRKPWNFVVVDSKEKLQELSLCKNSGAQLIAGAALAIVVTTDPLLADTWIEDASIAAAYIQLQAEELKLGSCWVQVRDRQTSDETSSEDYVRNALNIPLQQQVVCIIAIGHKSSETQAANLDDLEWEKVHIDEIKSPEVAAQDVIDACQLEPITEERKKEVQ
ncbi:MAG: nitroreductase family protein [Bacteroidaceae bacterium]